MIFVFKTPVQIDTNAAVLVLDTAKNGTGWAVGAGVVRFCFPKSEVFVPFGNIRYWRKELLYDNQDGSA